MYKVTTSYFLHTSSKESIILFVISHPLYIQGCLAGVVVAPHAGLSVRDAAAFRDVIPAVRAVVDRVQDQALVVGFGAKVRLFQQGIQYGQAGLEVFFAGFVWAALRFSLVLKVLA